MHIDSFWSATLGDGSNGVDCVFVSFTVPSELCQPDVVFRVDFCEPALGKRDFAVVAELVSIYWQLVPWPVVLLNMIFIREAEAPAYIVLFDGRPACQAGLLVEDRGIFYTI